MLINLRNALMAGKRWKNPYVTDGLVAMWDGEWNAGGGVHDASATFPRELIGKISPTASGTFEAGPDYFMFGSSYFEFTSQELVDAVYSGSATFEIVCFPTGSLVANGGIVAIDTTNRGLWVWQNTGNFFPRSTYRGEQLNLESNIGGCYQIVMGAASQTVYRNGAVYMTSAAGTATKGSNTVLIGKLPRFNMASAKVASIRIYSRALTADEIAANYAIDKARFGLP